MTMTGSLLVPGTVARLVSDLPLVAPPEVSPVRRMSTGVSVVAGSSVHTDLRDDDLNMVLVAFYRTLAANPQLAPYFTTLDMDAHMPRIVSFWSTLLFHTGRYSGNAFRPHLSMPGLTAEHFARWLAALEGTVDAHFAGEHTDRMKDLAHRIAYSMQMRLGIAPFEEYRREV